MIKRLRRFVLRALLAAAALPLVLTLPFRWLDPPTSSIILQRQVRSILESRSWPSHRWSDHERISQELKLAVLAAEDQKFPHHHGFDLDSIVDALQDQNGRRRGASTITQQVAKNLFLWPGRSLFRKGLEAYFSGAIEVFWPKHRILEIYLNIAEFGPDVFGAEAGSRFHFGKSAEALTRREAALLAAVLPNPAKMSASRPSEYVRERADSIGREIARMGGPAFLRTL